MKKYNAQEDLIVRYHWSITGTLKGIHKHMKTMEQTSLFMMLTVFTNRGSWESCIQLKPVYWSLKLLIENLGPAYFVYIYIYI